MLDEPLTLDELRRRRSNFHVPQSYRFIAADELGVVLNGEDAPLLGEGVALVEATELGRHRSVAGRLNDA